MKERPGPTKSMLAHNDYGEGLKNLQRTMIMPSAADANLNPGIGEYVIITRSVVNKSEITVESKLINKVCVSGQWCPMINLVHTKNVRRDVRGCASRRAVAITKLLYTITDLVPPVVPISGRPLPTKTLLVSNDSCQASASPPTLF